MFQQSLQKLAATGLPQTQQRRYFVKDVLVDGLSNTKLFFRHYSATYKEVQGHDRANQSPKLDHVQVRPDPRALFLQGPFSHGHYSSENVQYAEKQSL